MCMQALAIGAPDARVRRPTVLELTAAGMLATSVILHLIALIPQYYGGPRPGFAVVRNPTRRPSTSSCQPDGPLPWAWP